ncbi:MAG: heme o synthase [Phycisphaerales bacterium]|nr:heme o synthase [Phycisphaerales bacterium]
MNNPPASADDIQDDPKPTKEGRREKAQPREGLLPNLGELTKARLNMLVVGTTAVGFALAGTDRPAVMLFWTLVGTGLTAASAGMLNQLAEIDRDSRMERTEKRPLPAGLVSPKVVFAVSVLLAYAGVTVLGMLVNGLSAILALANVLIYVLVYTPLKPRTTLNTLVGAICGAIPPMIGWAAATGELGPGAWLLGALLFVWQLPHFFALALLYRDDYERGGFLMLPVVDRRGEITVQVILVTSLILVPVGLGATVLGISGWYSALAAILLGSMMSGLSLVLYIRRSKIAARRVFLGSLAYLPLMLGMMVIDGKAEAPPTPDTFESLPENATP